METTKLNQSNDNKSKFKLEYNQNITKCKKEDTGLYMHKSTLNNNK